MTLVKTGIWTYKWKRCSKKKCCKQCGQVKFVGTMAKWPVQKHTEITKHGVYKDNWFFVTYIIIHYTINTLTHCKLYINLTICNTCMLFWTNYDCEDKTRKTSNFLLCLKHITCQEEMSAHTTHKMWHLN